MFSFSRRRTYVCEYFDYSYVGVNKEVSKDWNNRFISFIPFLCGLTLELSQQLRSVCELESSSKLLFKQSVDDVQKVCSCMPLHVSAFLLVKRARVPCRLWWHWMWTSKLRNRKYSNLLPDFIQSSRTSKLTIVCNFGFRCFSQFYLSFFCLQVSCQC